MGIEVYEFDGFKGLAIHTIKEGWYGEVSESLELYIDYDKLVRHLKGLCCETIAVRITFTVINLKDSKKLFKDCVLER